VAAEQLVPLPRHSFPRVVVQYALQLVRSGASLRAAAKILSWLVPALGLGTRTPCYQAVRHWLLQVGLHELQRERSRGNDWVWLIDHTQQLGDKKVLLIVGLRLAQWRRDEPLAQRDLQLLAVHPEANSTGESLDGHLEELSQRVGAPRAIVSDGARDLRLGVNLFRARHPEHRLAWLYDIKHFAAVLLKQELEHDSDWQAFTTAANRTKQQCSVTALAALHPPNQRGKARYLNLQELLAWSQKVLSLLDAPRGPEHLGLDGAKCEARFGWVRDYRQQIAAWQAALAVVEITESHVRRGGVYRGLVAALTPQLQAAASGPLSQRLRDKLLAHLAEQADQTIDGEHLPASSESLESLIGTYKHLQGEQGHHGVTSLVLGLGTFLARDLAAIIPTALASTTSRTLLTWCREHLGATLQACRQRCRHFLSSRTKSNP
jgi:hypothetical protein